ncbi:beta-galactosidase [Paenibacillus sp. WQ 127069]|uniref:beta-galactosidase n=1 Tax=Paenibacillus baimaensis TaxID=2982185 RepID=A0ABT2UU41_9BACL|nr:beta-galactosidase [Paenibacillus sp. WQ 127069]MCU6798164.1 beta-galactosidase [Paenibacillus sp. WQ 127069]
MIYVGTNYHPHDWPRERWPVDIRMMKESGFNLVRLGHLCWDSFEPSEGNYNFAWFDEIMDLFADAGFKVVLDIATRPAPTWLHKKYPVIDITDRHRNRLHAVHRYMEDVGNPVFQEYAYGFAETLTKRYAGHSALYALGLCNEVGSGIPTFSEEARQRYMQWLKAKYGSIEELNGAWAAQRWSRKLSSFEDVEFPVSGDMNGAPERMLDMRRFFSDEQLTYLQGLSDIVRKYAPDVRETTNHWGENPVLGFDYLKEYKQIFDLPGIGFYPGVNPEDRNALFGACLTMNHRISEKDEPIWCLEFQTGSFGAYAPPKGVLRMYAYLSMLFRSEAICAWTWRSMLGGEEQYLFGLLDHDGLPGRKLDEFRQFAQEMEKLKSIGLPYLPKPEIALAYSFESFKVSENQRGYYKTTYLEQMMQTFLALDEDNVDCNIVNLRHIEKNYKLLLVPGHCIMDEASAQTIRAFVDKGGTVIMTAYSAKVDEHNTVFGTSMPGRLSDVFGIRANAFERPVYHYSDTNEGGLQKQKMNIRRETPKIKIHDSILDFPIDYYEILEPSSAEVLATFTNLESELPAVSVNAYGKGKAVYVAVPAQYELIQALLNHFYVQLDVKKGPETPKGVTARQVGDSVLYVNTTSSEQCINLPATGEGKISGRMYETTLHLDPYEVEVIVKEEKDDHE